jgi:RNA polymerase sigma-70 factor (ECF subfamily)
MMSAMDNRDPTDRADGPAKAAGAPANGAEPLDLGAAVASAQAGDEAAFRFLYRTVQPGLLRYLRALVGEEAEDVGSEAWSQIARDLASFTGDADAFRGWAATIARHRALDHLRRLRRRPVAATTDATTYLLTQRAPDDTETVALDALSTDRAVALIASLPGDQAEAVLLRVVLGLDAETAARVLGKRSGAVRTAAHRGLRRLAALLDQPAASSTGKRGHDLAGEPDA